VLRTVSTKGLVTRLIEIPLDAGGSILVEVDEPTHPLVRGGREDVIERAGDSFETVLDRVRPAYAAVLQRFSDVAEGPEEISLEFGLKLTAEAGAIIAKAGGEANFTISVTWRKHGRQ
jgi:hypothetical protein